MNFLSRFSIRQKFRIILAIQVVLLVAVALLGCFSLQRLQADFNQTSQRLNRAAKLTQVIANANRIRIVHVSLFGASEHPEYVAKRLKRLQELETVFGADLEKLESMEWDALDRPRIAEAVGLLRHYTGAFGPLFERARQTRNADVTIPMEANYGEMNQARDLLDKLLEAQRSGAEALTAQAIERAMSALHRGDLTHISAVGSKDELGHISASLDQAVANLRNDILGISAISERNVSATTELASSLSETSRTVDDLAQLVAELRQLTSKFKVA